MEDEKLYDISGLQEFVEDDEEQVIFLVSIFLEDVPQMLNDLNRAYRAGDMEKVKFFSHKLKSSIDLFKINTLHAVIRSIEQYAKAGTNLEQLETLLNKTNTVLTQVMDELKEEYSLA
jgi:HPt (histidine-containing phosphotransfer) domain-containing protein